MKRLFVFVALTLILISCTHQRVNDQLTNNDKPNSTMASKSSKEVDLSKIPEDVDKLGGAKADDFFIGELIANYERLLIHAINNNEFSAIENLLILNSPLYHSQKKLVEDLYHRKVQEKLINFTIKDIERTDTEDVYKAYVKESIAIKYPEKQDFETKEFSWIYTILKSGEKAGLSNIEKWIK
ncbi:TcaA NTF2-like domain-containing protein [Paenibacillus sp. FSL H8-0034]|uniref:TcaA NTF2-like domain-containing protein n=1 Tax=Paenibacillus sp. FSL H8-0034 TaxID=2954671 RepID=UPI0030FB1F0C